MAHGDPLSFLGEPLEQTRTRIEQESRTRIGQAAAEGLRQKVKKRTMGTVAPGDKYRLTVGGIRGQLEKATER